MYAVSQFLHADYGKKKFQTWTLKLQLFLFRPVSWGGGGLSLFGMSGVNLFYGIWDPNVWVHSCMYVKSGLKRWTSERGQSWYPV